MHDVFERNGCIQYIHYTRYALSIYTIIVRLHFIAQGFMGGGAADNRLFSYNDGDTLKV